MGGVKVIEGHTGQMTDRVEQSDSFFADGKYFSSARSCGGGQVSSILKHNRQMPLIKHPT